MPIYVIHCWTFVRDVRHLERKTSFRFGKLLASHPKKDLVDHTEVPMLCRGACVSWWVSFETVFPSKRAPKQPDHPREEQRRRKTKSGLADREMHSRCVKESKIMCMDVIVHM